MDEKQQPFMNVLNETYDTAKQAIEQFYSSSQKQIESANAATQEQRAVNDNLRAELDSYKTKLSVECLLKEIAMPLAGLLNSINLLIDDQYKERILGFVGNLLIAFSNCGIEVKYHKPCSELSKTEKCQLLQSIPTSDSRLNGKVQTCDGLGFSLNGETVVDELIALYKFDSHYTETKISSPMEYKHFPRMETSIYPTSNSINDEFIQDRDFIINKNELYIRSPRAKGWIKDVLSFDQDVITLNQKNLLKVPKQISINSNNSTFDSFNAAPDMRGRVVNFTLYCGRHQVWRFNCWKLK